MKQESQAAKFFLKYLGEKYYFIIFHRITGAAGSCSIPSWKTLITSMKIKEQPIRVVLINITGTEQTNKPSSVFLKTFLGFQKQQPSILDTSCLASPAT